MAADEPQISPESIRMEVSSNAGSLAQIGAARDVYVGVPGPAPEPVPTDPWPNKVWDHTAEAGRIRPAVAEIAGELHERWQAAEEALADDPWLDRDFARRMTERLGDLLDGFEQPMKFTPVEAAVLALAPLTYQVWSAESAVELLGVNPTDRQAEVTDPRRPDYEKFLAGPEQSRLINRAGLTHLEGRGGPQTRDAIKWWLFHQWVRSLPPVPHHLPGDGTKLTKILDGLLKKVGHLFRLSPDELRDETNRAGLEADATYPGMPRELRHADEERTGLLLVVARDLAIDPLMLPATLVEHLGIPRSVDLAEFWVTVDEAVWKTADDMTSLVAHCHHEAVLESLREYVNHTSAALSAVRAVAKKPTNLQVLRELPTTASADYIRPADGAAFLTPVAKFQLDDARVRELLMGEQLYGDRSLAIRELYQNALDACRWQKARFAAGGEDWANGRIEFVQREENGRHILRCTDNGIGMTESDLREVFSRAGVRFADRREFLDEAAKWEAKGIRFFPNSRFGIGVLSYFMLADEIEVTTRRRSLDGRTTPTLRVMIAGPGHLFRIEELVDENQPFGTSVTLYLRDGGTAPSCVEVLQRLLGIAEFDTYADHDGIQDVWHQSEFKIRQRPEGNTHRIEASGDIVQCAAGENGQVVWCEEGGGLLVDGIHVGLPDKDHQIRGAIVNLTGRAAPRLTVDRALVRDDVTRDVEDLMIAAVPELLQEHPRFLTFDWLCEIVRPTPAVADVLTARIASAGLSLRTEGAELDIRATGCFPFDRRQVARLDVSQRSYVPTRVLRDHVVLWRLLAHVGNRALSGLSAETREVLPALPSDELLVDQLRASTEAITKPERVNVPPGHVVTMALAMNTDPANVLRRLATLGTDLGKPVPYPDLRSLEKTDATLLSKTIELRSWLDPNEPVPLGHVIATHRLTGMAVADIVYRLGQYGFDTRNFARELPQLTYQDQFLVSTRVNGAPPWIAHKNAVSPAHVIFAAFTLRLNVMTVVDRLIELGFTVAPFNRSLDWIGEITSAVANLLQGRLWRTTDNTASRADVVRTAAEWKLSPRKTARMLTDMSFDVPPSTEIPDQLDELDMALLDNLWAFGTPDRLVVSLQDLAEAADRAKCAPATAAARLATHGFHVPPATVVAHDFDKIHRYLIDAMRFSSTPWAMFAKLFEAAWRFEEPVSEISKRLGELGYYQATVIDLFKPAYVEESYPGHSWVPVAFVIVDASRASRNPAPMLDLVRSLGFSVLPADLPADWSDALNIKLVNRLDLGEPISVRHVLDTALWHELPIQDVVDGFQSLGLEVPDMAAALPPLLDRVPFQD